MPATTIITKLHQLAATVKEENDLTGNSPTGEQFAAEAVEAILAGAVVNDGSATPPPTPQWKAYMEHFAESPEQLNRLTLQDAAKNQFTVRRSLAYIVSNAVCGAISTTKTFENVADEIEP